MNPRPVRRWYTGPPNAQEPRARRRDCEPAWHASPAPTPPEGAPRARRLRCRRASAPCGRRLAGPRAPPSGARTLGPAAGSR
eukprot:14715889-Alexandrium_andersonii.AAC.1